MTRSTKEIEEAIAALRAFGKTIENMKSVVEGAVNDKITINELVHIQQKRIAELQIIVDNRGDALDARQRRIETLENEKREQRLRLASTLESLGKAERKLMLREEEERVAVRVSGPVLYRVWKEFRDKFWGVGTTLVEFPELTPHNQDAWSNLAQRVNELVSGSKPADGKQGGRAL